jgi:rhodanese-related sulfurtransferase
MNPLEITPAETQQRLSGERPPLLVDCRESREVALCRIGGALHIPMNDIPMRLKELDPTRETIIYCHHGRRSLMVAGYLANQGFERVYSLRGGIEAWSDEVDPTVPRY